MGIAVCMGVGGESVSHTVLTQHENENQEQEGKESGVWVEGLKDSQCTSELILCFQKIEFKTKY